MKSAVLSLCLLGLLAAPAVAVPDPVRITGSLEDLDLPRDDWFGIYLQGKKVGHARMAMSLDGEGDEARIVFAHEFRIKMVAMGRKHVMLMKERLFFLAREPFTFVGGASDMVQNDERKRVETVREGDKLKAVVTEGSERRELTVDAPDYTAWDDVCLEMWVRKGPKVGESLSFRSFDLSDLDEDVQTFVLKDVKSLKVSGVETRYFEGTMSSEDDGEMGTARSDARGRLLTITLGGIMELRAEPKDLAKQAGYSSDLFALSMVKIDRPIGDPHKVQSLVLEAIGEGAAKLVNGPRQQVTSADDRVILRLGTRARESVRATEEEIAEALEATVDYPIEDPGIVKLAKEAIGDAQTDSQKVARLVAFVSEYIEDKYGADSTSVKKVIDQRVGDCTEHALLFVCLARAAGIPTREATGVAYMGDEVQAFGAHAWNEVVLDGVWVPVDATFNEVVADGAHIRFGAEGKGGMVLLSTMGRLSFRLLELNGTVK